MRYEVSQSEASEAHLIPCVLLSNQRIPRQPYNKAWAITSVFQHFSPQPPAKLDRLE